MNVRSCEYLIAIWENGTLSNAAKSLGVSQPTLSSFVANTERQLGHALFTRQQKKMLPTEAGRIYLEACQRILETKNRTYHAISGLSDNYDEHFTVGVTPHRGSTLFASIYARFCQRYPRVSISVQEGYIGSLLNALDTGACDLIISATSDKMATQYNSIVHNQEELVLCVPDFHPFAALSSPLGTSRATIDINRFQDTPFVMWGDQTTNYRVIQGLLQEKNMSPTVVYESNNVLFIDSMLTSGAGVGFLPAQYCKPDQARVYFSMDPPLKHNIGLLYPKGKELTQAQRYFVYLSLRTRLTDATASFPCMNEEAKKIYQEFKETDDGYTPA